MTLEELKRMDRLIRRVPDPFGSGYQTWMKILKEYAEKKRDIGYQHSHAAFCMEIQELVWRKFFSVSYLKQR
jgi:hypothetical protein